MDILRKGLDAFYEGQHLSDEKLDCSALIECRRQVNAAVEVEADCHYPWNMGCSVGYISPATGIINLLLQ